MLYTFQVRYHTVWYRWIEKTENYYNKTKTQNVNEGHTYVPTYVHKNKNKMDIDELSIKNKHNFLCLEAYSILTSS